MSSAVLLQLGKLRHGGFHRESVAEPGTRSQSGVGLELGAGCNAGPSQHGLSFRIEQGEVAGGVLTAILEHWGCGPHSCCRWEREAVGELCLHSVTLWFTQEDHGPCWFAVDARGGPGCSSCRAGVQGPDPGSSLPAGGDADAATGGALSSRSRASLHDAAAPAWGFIHLYGF